MGVLSENARLGASAVSDEYKAEYSLTFDKVDEEYLGNDLSGSQTKTQKCTFSFWFRRGDWYDGSSSAHQVICSAKDTSGLGNDLEFRFTEGDVNGERFEVYFTESGVGTGTIITKQLRSSHSWYHIVVSIDTTQATEANRLKMWVNGYQYIYDNTPQIEPPVGQPYNMGLRGIGTWAAPTQNMYLYFMSGAGKTAIGASYDDTRYWDGQISEFYYIDGTAYEATDFGKFNDKAKWVPIEFEGTYGSRGGLWCSNAMDPTDEATFGNDNSGNNNHLTPIGANNPPFEDTGGGHHHGSACNKESPSDYTNSALTDVGGTFNRMDMRKISWNDATASRMNFRRGGQEIDFNFNDGYTCDGIMGVDGGKWYYEIVVMKAGDTSNFDGDAIGWTRMGWNHTGTKVTQHSHDEGGYYYRQNGDKLHEGTSTNYGNTWGSVGDVIGCAIDLTDTDDVSMTFYKNGTSQGSAFTGVAKKWSNCVSYWMPIVGLGESDYFFNFGQHPWKHDPPAGHAAMCTTNIDAVYGECTAPRGFEAFEVYCYEGSDGNQNFFGGGDGTVGGVANFGEEHSTWRPDLIIATNVSTNNTEWLVYDTLTSNQSSNLKHWYWQGHEAASTTDRGMHDLDGYGTTDDLRIRFSGTDSYLNQSGEDYIWLCWNMGGKGDSSNAVSNTDGTITSNVLANVPYGQCIITWTGTGANATIGHGLGIEPYFAYIKNLDDAVSPINWHRGWGTKGQNHDTSNSPGTDATFFNDTLPTSSLIHLGSSEQTNGSGDAMVAYVWGQVRGYSRGGRANTNSTQNIANSFYTGFKPSLIMWRTHANSQNTVYRPHRYGPHHGKRFVRNHENSHHNVAGNGLGWVETASGWWTGIENNNELGGNQGYFFAWGEQPYQYNRGTIPG